MYRLRLFKGLVLLLFLWRIMPKTTKDFIVAFFKKRIQLDKEKKSIKAIADPIQPTADQSVVSIQTNPINPLSTLQTPAHSTLDSSESYTPIDTSLALYKSLHSHTWTLLTSPIEPLQIRKTPLESHTLFSGSYTLKHTPYEILSCIQNNEARSFWDARFVSSRLLSTLSNGDALLHTRQRGSYLISDRDFVVVQGLRVMEDGVALVATSVPSAYQGAPGAVRAEVILSVWEMKRQSDGVKVSYNFCVNVGGSIPKSVVEQVQKSTPVCIERVGKYLDECGACVCVVKDDAYFKGVRVTNEKGDGKEFVVSVEVTVGKVSIGLPLVYEDGFELKVEGGDPSAVECRALAEIGFWQVLTISFSFHASTAISITIIPKHGANTLNGNPI